ncbi:MAG: hypothetical protein KJN82_05120 [Bacteroidia bacterium]|nr:hypothetical protein [Bacteroidia bacterium]
MKKITLVMAALLIGLTSATATVSTKTNNGKKLGITKRYHFTQPVMFVERGVEFLIFPNGEFDFNTELVSAPYDDNVYYKGSSRRSNVNRTYGAPGSYANFHSTAGTLVLHDRYGKVRRIGNIFLNYDYYGRIKRVGSVYMRYRHNRLVQVGGLKLLYNRHGKFVGTRGKVNRYNHGYNYFTPSNNYGNGFGSYHWEDNFDEDYDDNFYYYKKNDKVVKRSKRSLKK